MNLENDINFKKIILKELETKNVDQIMTELRNSVELVLVKFVCGDRLSNSNRIIRI